MDITSDRGSQFTPSLWTQLNRLLGIDTKMTTAYHPQANGMVERLHRQLKAGLKARTTGPNWFAQLPMVLLGIRSSWRVDPGCSPAELVYGSTLRIPGEFLQPRDARTMEPDLPFLRKLERTMMFPPAWPQPITFTLEGILTDTHSNVLMTDPFAYWIRRKNISPLMLGDARRLSPLIV